MIRSKKRLVSWIVTLFGAVGVLGLILPSDALLELMRAILLATAAGVAAAHFPFVRALVASNRAPLDEVEITGFGWFLVSSGTAMWAAWYLVWKTTGFPDLWWDDYLLAFLSAWSSIGLLIVLVVPRSRDGYIPVSAWWWIGVKTSVFVTLILIALALIRLLSALA